MGRLRMRGSTLGGLRRSRPARVAPRPRNRSRCRDPDAAASRMDPQGRNLGCARRRDARRREPRRGCTARVRGGDRSAARVLRLGAEHIQAHPDWSYTTFTAQAPCDEAWDKLVPLDRESLEMRWVRLSAPSALSGLSGLSAPSARRNGTTWERPVPGTDDVYGEAPLLPAFDAVWEELAVLLPAPSAEIGRSPARDRSGSHDIGGRDGRD